MKHILTTLTLFSVLSNVAVAYADNRSVEDAVRERADLSSFYQALINTGVNHELKPNDTYTVFAPTNAAFAQIRKDQYPCFYAQECNAQVAAIVRNHIVPGTVHIDEATKQRGGVYSISGRFVNVGEPSRDDYTVDGHNIVQMAKFGSDILYKIDGVIANPREMSSLQYYQQYAYDVPRQTTSVTERTIDDPACGPRGCPDEVTATTTTTRPAPLTGPMLSPGR